MTSSECDGLGLDYGEVQLLPSDPRWPRAFDRVVETLRSALGDAVQGVEHVGSTAVPGLIAKPIVDIAVGLALAVPVEGAISALERSGFEYRGDNGDNGGHLLVLNTGPNHRVAHVHVVVHGDPCWHRYLTFRERLRTDSAARDRYSEVKQQLARLFPHDRQSYTAGKAAFITELLCAATEVGQLNHGPRREG